MNKTEVINKIAERANLSRKEAANVLEVFIDTVTTALAENEQVNITGFGTFKILETGVRKASESTVQEEIVFEPKETLMFNPGWKMNRKVEPTRVKPILPGTTQPDNYLAILIILRSMVKVRYLSDLKGDENRKVVCRFVKKLPINGFTLQQWWIAAQFITNTQLNVLAKTDAYNMIVNELLK
jgi:DNA-binding protein HU-beta